MEGEEKKIGCVLVFFFYLLRAGDFSQLKASTVMHTHKDEEY